MAYCAGSLAHACDLSGLHSLPPDIEKDVYEVLRLRGPLNARSTHGGRAAELVRRRLHGAKSRCAEPWIKSQKRLHRLWINR